MATANNGQFKKDFTPWNKGKIGFQISTRKGLKLKPHTDEHREKIRLAGIGRIFSDETRKKIGDKHRGKIMSEETRKKMSISATNSPNKIYKNTSIEIKLQNLLKDNGIEFETNYPILGRPDIFIKPNIAIFADGCYWHKCPECGFKEGIRKENETDQRVTRELQSRGYVVIRLWEHEIKANISVLNQKIQGLFN